MLWVIYDFFSLLIVFSNRQSIGPPMMRSIVSIIMRRRLDCLFVFKRHVNPNSMCLRRASAEMSMLQHLFNCINNTSILTSSVSSRSKPVWHNTRSIFTLSHRRCLEVSKSNFLACRRSLSSWQEEMQKSPAIVVYGLMGKRKFSLFYRCIYLTHSEFILFYLFICLTSTHRFMI